MDETAILTTPDRSGLDISPEAFEIIRRILKSRASFNLDSYKDKCIRRRIAIRLRATHATSAEEYCDLLKESETELEHLVKVLTIHVSQFFRNPSTFHKLREETIPLLFNRARATGRDRLALLSVGCAGGEEPYSLAMIIHDSFGDQLAEIKVSITATDIDLATLEQAKKGIYGEDRLTELSQGMRLRYFQKKDGKFQLLPEIRDMVSFHHGDMFESCPADETDLILCRNVLIYFERSVQEKILRNLAATLRPGGFLVLGKSETLVGESRRHFRTICPVERIYQVTK